MRFEWDQNKNELNKIKHGIRFEQVLDFFDEGMIMRYDWLHSVRGDERFIGIGRITKDHFATVVFQEKEDSIRIISARKSSSSERKEYYDQNIRHSVS